MSDQLDNILVRQKDKLISMIDNATSPQRLQRAVAALKVVQELWETCSYSYKYDELRERIRLKQNRFRSKDIKL
jgi:3-methyladenine DNA glycosylase Tag